MAGHVLLLLLTNALRERILCSPYGERRIVHVGEQALMEVRL
jgi:hypothetical protein